jgi:hypothetical protein
MTTFTWDDASTWHADPEQAEDELAEDELSWCSTCREWSLMTPLTDDVSEEPIDPDFPQMLCEGCGYATPAGYQPEPEVPHYVVGQESPYYRVVRT